jgi:hypothetical protein
MEAVPTGNAAVAKVATPPLSVPLPSVDVPFMNVTLPVGVVPDTAEVTVAVNFTAFP